ncbi:hypothetical protein J1605_000507 [Eschrichtius robustus]|uniref:RNA-binding protein with serine-rich domain 1 n=1 Tax=Eschrichtius robustus TaxID=9764 RepID=A0AB34H660_ESCRO|nr:hypothetical protein J1605_000507 [Eschrichtius robustus]
MEIFSTYGKIKMIDEPVERMHPHLSTGYAYVEFENPEEAEKVLKHMDGGHIDGQEITATAVLAPWPRPPHPHLAIQPSQESAATASHVAQVTPTDEKVAFPSARSPVRRRHRSRSSSNSSRKAGPPKLCPVSCIPSNSLLSLF